MNWQQSRDMIKNLITWTKYQTMKTKPKIWSKKKHTTSRELLKLNRRKMRLMKNLGISILELWRSAIRDQELHSMNWMFLEILNNIFLPNSASSKLMSLKFYLIQDKIEVLHKRLIHFIYLVRLKLNLIFDIK